MRTKHRTGVPSSGGRVLWTGTAAAVLIVTASPRAFSVPARASFDYYGEFANVADAPKGTGKIGGFGAMVVTTRATTISLNATGLDPKATYIADVHDQACFLKEGGDRFRFDPSGPMAPPNAIWLYPIKVDDAGTGTAATTLPVPAGPRAKSLVLHLLRSAGAKKDESNAPRLACADLSRTTS